MAPPVHRNVPPGPHALVLPRQIGYGPTMSSAILLAHSARTSASALALILGLLLLLRLART